MSKPIYIGYYRNNLNLEAIGFETSEKSWKEYLQENNYSHCDTALFTARSMLTSPF
jgi:hypothetical protein